MKIENKNIVVQYFIDGDFEIPVKELLNSLESLKDWEGMDWEDHFHWFLPGQDKLAEYLVMKGIIIKHPELLCHHLKSEEKRSEFYFEVLKLYNLIEGK